MSQSAVPDGVGRRPAFGIAFLLVAYLFLAPPLFVLAPLLLLLLASRPTTGREWLWIALATLVSVRLGTGTAASASLPNRLVLAGAVTVAGAFLILSALLRNSSTVGRALAAVGVTSLALTLWSRSAGIGMDDLDQAIRAELEPGVSLFLKGAGQTESANALAFARELARLFLGLLALQAVAGLTLAWAWYHRIAGRPLSPPPGPFRDFRFNDHLVWGAIVTLALAVLPVGDSFTRAAQNGLVVWGGLYAARGLAVVVTAIGPWPLSGKLLVMAFALLTLPVAIGTLITLGLADTWLDFRRRFSAPEAGGYDAD